MSLHTPPSRPSSIEGLISGVDRYNPHNLPLLHEYLESQLRNEAEWDVMAGLAILKLYQFNPTTFDLQLVLSLLAKSLHAVPAPDFNLCLSLLGEAPVAILSQKNSSDANESTEAGEDGQDAPSGTAAAAATSASTSNQPDVPSAGILTEPLIVKLHHLAQLLSSSRYPTFWTTLRSSEYDDVRAEVLDTLTDFDDGVRGVILQGTSSAFKSIGKPRLARYLGLSEGELPAFLSSSPAAQGWTLNGDLVTVPVNENNELKNTNVVSREEVALADLSKLLGQTASSSTPSTSVQREAATQTHPERQRQQQQQQQTHQHSQQEQHQQHNQREIRA